MNTDAPTRLTVDLVVNVAGTAYDLPGVPILYTVRYDGEPYGARDRAVVDEARLADEAAASWTLHLIGIDAGLYWPQRECVAALNAAVERWRDSRAAEEACA